MRAYHFVLSKDYQADPKQDDILASSIPFNYSALDIDFDIPVSKQGAPSTQATIKIWGLSPSVLQSIQKYRFGHDFGGTFRGYRARLWAGFQKGLPLATLANPAGSNLYLLLDSNITNLFNSWELNDRSATFIAQGAASDTTLPNTTAAYWKANSGDLMADTLARCLHDLGASSTKDMLNAPIHPYDQAIAVSSLNDLIAKLAIFNQTAIYTLTGNPPVAIYAQSGGAYTVTDRPALATTGVPRPVKVVQPFELQGVPVWVNYAAVQLHINLRGDLSLGDIIKFDPKYFSSTSISYLPFQSFLVRNNFKIIAVRHQGRFRNPAGQSWSTYIEAVVSAS